MARFILLRVARAVLTLFTVVTIVFFCDASKRKPFGNHVGRRGDFSGRLAENGRILRFR